MDDDVGDEGTVGRREREVIQLEVAVGFHLDRFRERLDVFDFLFAVASVIRIQSSVTGCTGDGGQGTYSARVSKNVS